MKMNYETRIFWRNGGFKVYYTHLAISTNTPKGDG